MKKVNKRYMIQLNDNCEASEFRLFSEYLNNNNNFIGYLENITSTSLYFSTENGDGLIIIPHHWVLWCAPINEKEGDPA